MYLTRMFSFVCCVVDFPSQSITFIIIIREKCQFPSLHPLRVQYSNKEMQVVSAWRQKTVYFIYLFLERQYNSSSHGG